MILLVYRFLINLVLFISPLIILFRLIKKKEDLKRFKEKLGFFSKKKIKNNLVWFHGASVGELLSIIPLIEKLERNNKVDQILVTTSTLSSAKVFNNFKFKKTIHQFFYIDTKSISKKFINYWKPSLALFVDSEIWPNTLLSLKKNKIYTILINGRITKKSFNRWKIFKSFSKKIFNCFSDTFPCNKETEKYLKLFEVKSIKPIDNLKFSQKKSKKNIIPIILKKFFSKKKFWCAASTHHGEEEFCLNIHKNIKEKQKDLVTILIPRHINRKENIIKLMKNFNLKFHCHSWKKKISHNIDIYLVDTYGETEIFYNLSEIVFMGGSLIKHGGQNPLEAARNGCKIIHGPYINNFKDIYKLLDNLNISEKIHSPATAIVNIQASIKGKKGSSLIIRKIEMMGIKVLDKVTKELNKVI